ncbi:MAG TPA: Dyp-type peroxidase, partial [Polyangiales bacterium]
GPGRHFLQASQNPNDAEQGLPGSDLLWPGEFVFGYPQQDETDIDRPGPIADGGLPFMKNGSFMAFRRLAQSVPEFDQFVETTADALGMDSALLGARLIGRWKSGAPLEIAPLQDDVNLASDPLENNDFEFDGDPKGRRCPFAAHIRKAYPRNDITALGQTRDESEADTQTHRVLRRGIPFGSEVGDAPVTVPSGSIPSTDPGRGLMFVCYQTSIEQQFQFIQKHWFNDPTFAPSGDNPGFDPILGQFPDQRPFQGAVPSYPTGDRGAQIALSQNFVVPTGGGYFFMPSLSALANVLSQ